MTKKKNSNHTKLITMFRDKQEQLAQFLPAYDIFLWGFNIQKMFLLDCIHFSKPSPAREPINSH